ncbi:MAG: DUF3147 domain-containing protein, partial [Nitrospira sp.]|nr:DUF3147 domain-containing protein [Nitrospira sp.]
WDRKGRSFLAAFASTFPAMTGATFILIYLNGSNEHIVTSTKNLLWFVPPWLVYVWLQSTDMGASAWLSMAGSMVLYVTPWGW